MVIQNATQKKNAARTGRAYCMLAIQSKRFSYLEKAHKIYKACKEFEARYNEQEETKTNHGQIKWVA